MVNIHITIWKWYDTYDINIIDIRGIHTCIIWNRYIHTSFVLSNPICTPLPPFIPFPINVVPCRYDRYQQMQRFTAALVHFFLSFFFPHPFYSSPEHQQDNMHGYDRTEEPTGIITNPPSKCILRRTIGFYPVFGSGPTVDGFILPRFVLWSINYSTYYYWTGSSHSRTATLGSVGKSGQEWVLLGSHQTFSLPRWRKEGFKKGWARPEPVPCSNLHIYIS
jgi:hypothetical protein